MTTAARDLGPDISRRKQRIYALSGQISKHTSRLLSAATRAMAKGSIYTQKKKCGNPKCKCAGGKLHTARILSFSHEGRTRLIPLTKYPISEVMEIEKQVKRYQSFRKNRAGIVYEFKQLISEINKLERGLLVEVSTKKGGKGHE